MKGMANYKSSVSSIIDWGHWFTFFNIIIAIVQSARYVLDAGHPTSLIGNLFLFTYTLGHFGFLFFTLFVLLLFPLAFILPFFRTYRTLGIGLATLGQAALILDAQFYRELGMHSNRFLYELFIQGEGNGVGTEWWKVGLAFTLLLLIEIVLANWVSRWRESRSRRILGKRISAVFLFCLLSYNLSYAVADAFNYAPITRQATYYPLSYPLTAKTALRKAGLIGEDDFAHASQGVEYDGSFNYPKTVLNPRAVANPPNVVWVVVSGLKADMLNATNMPITLEQARKGLWAVNHYSGGNDMRDGMFSMLYGIPAAYADEALYSQTPPYFAQFLRQQGYQNHTFSSVLNMSAQNRATLLKSFDSIWVPSNVSNPALTDIQAVHNWKQAFIKQQQPTFDLLQLNSVVNYATPPGFENPFKPDLEGVIFMDQLSQPDPRLLKNRYQNAVLHMDQLLHQIYQTVANTNTILLVTSDFGQSFTQHGNQPIDEDEDFSPEMMRVPLLITGPGIESQLINGLSSHLDLVPSLLSKVALTPPKSRTYSSGFNMFAADFQRDWLLMGNHKAFSVKQSTQQVVVKKFGEYQVLDSDYRVLPDSQLDTVPLIKAVKEMRRFVR